jgi:hypothetical protein
MSWDEAALNPMNGYRASKTFSVGSMVLLEFDHHADPDLGESHLGICRKEKPNFTLTTVSNRMSDSKQKFLLLTPRQMFLAR